MNKLDVNNTHNGCAFLGVVLAVLLFSVCGWGACESGDYRKSKLGSDLGFPLRENGTYCDMHCAVNNPNCSSSEFCTGNIIQSGGYFYTGCGDCSVDRSYCKNVGYSDYVYRSCNTRCASTCEADSIVCQNSGGIWTNTGASTCGGYSCKINHCKAADSTWLSASIAACTGSNNYAIVNTDSTCEHVGTCCPNDSIPIGNVCKWRCDSALTQCNGRVGSLFGAVLPDTSVSGEDTTFSYQCFYNCAYSPNPDSTVYLVEGNTVLAGPSDSIADGIKSEWFSSIRSTTGSIYVYDYLSPAASEYVDSIAAMKCVEHLWRCVINNKYVYWYDNQEVPAGCTNIVRVK